MLKKIIISLLFIIGVFLIQNISFSACGYNGGNISSAIDGCLGDTGLVKPDGNAVIEDGFKTKLLYWVKNIAGFLGLMAIGAIVWGGFMMVFSAGEEEKIKKAKDMVKWAILGFLGIVLASSLIALVVNFMYSL